MRNAEGPFEILRRNKHMYKVALKRGSGTKEKWLPRDRLRRCHELTQCSLPDIVEGIDSESDFSSDSSSSSDENIADVEPARYNLRIRPTRQTERLIVAQISLI